MYQIQTAARWLGRKHETMKNLTQNQFNLLPQMEIITIAATGQKVVPLDYHTAQLPTPIGTRYDTMAKLANEKPAKFAHELNSYAGAQVITDHTAWRHIRAAKSGKEIAPYWLALYSFYYSLNRQ